MRLLLLLLSLASAPLIAPPARAALVENGSSDYVIILDDLATEPERHAARELQRYVREVSGVVLPIMACRDTENETTMHPHEIMVGWSGYDPAKIGYHPRLVRAMRQHNVQVDLHGLGEEGFFIATAGPHLLIAGGRVRGTLYGVYAFLEKYLGCRWYDSTVSMIPRKDRIELPPAILDVQKPAFSQRFIQWGDFRYDPDLAARNKANQGPKLSDIHGGSFPGASRWHTFEFLLDSKKYFQDHPEYYALRDGKRVAAQPCLTHPEGTKLLIEKVKQWMRDEPRTRVFHVSQNDNDAHCTCPDCARLDAQEESPQGSLLTFINRVADEVKDEFPGRYVMTFAYAYSEKAPKNLKPRPNVIIQLCTFASCSIFDYETDGMLYKSERGSFGPNMKRWQELTKNIFIWDYAGSLCHHLMPTPNLNRLGPNLRFLSTGGYSGYFAQAPDACYGNMGGLNSLRAWLLARLAWDTSFDVAKGMDGYLADYYGKAAPPIREYIALHHDSAPPHDTYRGDNKRLAAWFHTPAEEYWCKPELLARYDALFDQAEKLVADDPATLRRVRIARLEVQYAQIRVLPVDNPRRPAIIKRFFEGVQLGGIKTIGWFIVPDQSYTDVEAFRTYLDKGGW